MENVQLSNTYELGDKWLEREFRHVNFGDKRLITRLIKTTTLLESKASGSINQSCKSWREAKGAYRLFSNKKFNPEEIYSSHYKETGEIIKDNKYVFSVQDTSNLDFDSHIKTKGVGSISKAYTKHKMGLMVHTTLMLTMEGLPLGLSSQQCWARASREETAQERSRRKYISSIKEKESYKWITALKDTMNIIAKGTQVVTIGDREADIFELLWSCQELCTLFIVRNRQNRKFICPEIGKTNLQMRINQIPEKREMLLQIPKKQGQKAREAKIEIKYMSGLIPIRLGYARGLLFKSNVPGDIKRAGYQSLGIGFLMSLIFPLLGFVLINKKSSISLHGDAKFASLKDIQGSSSVSLGNEHTKGIVVGKYQGKLIRYLKSDFVSLGAGTRSGKGASIVIPNLLEWQESAIVLDIKQECFNITSKYRQQVLKQDVFLFNPFSFQTHKFNPLYYIDLDQAEGSTDLMGLTEIIFPTDSVTGAERYFNNAAQSLFIALGKTLWLFRDKKVLFLKNNNISNLFSIGNLFDLYKRVSVEELISILKEDIETGKMTKLAEDNAQDAIDRMNSFHILGVEGKASTIATFEKQLKLFALPVVKNATNGNNFDFRDMRRKKMTVYLSIQPKDIKIASLILNLFFNCAIKINLSENPDFNPELKHNLLIILDEFPSIGNIAYVKESAGYIAGYKIQLLTIFQNISQLNEIYGAQGRKTLLANHSCKIIFAPNEQDDAEYFSREIAFTTATSTSKSKNNNKFSASSSISQSKTKRPLMLPQELKLMPFEEEILLINGEHPIKCNKALYFNDPFFMNKLIPLSPTLQAIAARNKKLPSKEQLALALNNEELAAKIS